MTCLANVRAINVRGTLTDRRGAIMTGRARSCDFGMIDHGDRYPARRYMASCTIVGCSDMRWALTSCL